MKAEIIETKKHFEPIEIKLVIESEEELCDLWHRTNVAPSAFYNFEGYNINQLRHGVGANNTLWRCVNELIKRKRLTS